MLNYINILDLGFEKMILSIFSARLEQSFFLITELGGLVFISLVFFLTAIFLRAYYRDFLKYYVVYFVMSEVVVYMMKIIIAKPRPLGAILYGETSGSMPSGHAAAAIFVYGFICYLIYIFNNGMYYRKAIISTLVLLILAIGLSRLYLDVHFLSDVAVGYVIGGSFLSLLISKLNSLKNG